jgi:hypothetical protein
MFKQANVVKVDENIIRLEISLRDVVRLGGRPGSPVHNLSTMG